MTGCEVSGLYLFEFRDLPCAVRASHKMCIRDRDEAAYIPLFFKHNIFGVRAGIQYTPSCDDHILAWDFTF